MWAALNRYNEDYDRWSYARFGDPWDEYLRVEKEEMGMPYPDGINVSLNGAYLDFGGTAPLAASGCTMVPFRAFLEGLGAEVAFDGSRIAAALELYERQVDERLLVRRLYLTACHVIPEAEAAKEAQWGQLDLFSDQNAAQSEQEALERERRIQETLLTIKKKFGKNAVLKGLDLEKGATARMRNDQIGGHKA